MAGEHGEAFTGKLTVSGYQYPVGHITEIEGYDHGICG
jgi:hypothetical protein